MTAAALLRDLGTKPHLRIIIIIIIIYFIYIYFGVIDIRASFLFVDDNFYILYWDKDTPESANIGGSILYVEGSISLTGGSHLTQGEGQSV